MKYGVVLWMLCIGCSFGDAVTFTGSGTSLHKAPFISPHVIHRLFNSGVQAVELAEMNGDFTGCDYWVAPPAKSDERPAPYFSQEIPLSICQIYFSYQFLKHLPSGIDVLYVVESGGGSGIFHSLCFVKRESTQTIEFEENGKWTAKQTTILRKIGQYYLGDRYCPARSIQFEKDHILIPETDGWFANHPDHTNHCQIPRNIKLPFLP